MTSYVDLGPAFPYLIRNGNMCPGDFDGDGRVEIASYCQVNNTLNVLAYFAYADASPMWSSATSGQLINAWGCIQAIPPGPNVEKGWQLSSDDQYLAVSFSAGTASLVIFNPVSLTIGVVQWSGQQMQLVWASQGSSAEYCGLAADDQFFAADLDGDGNDELVQFDPSNQWLFGMAWNGAGFTLLSDSHLTVGPWTLSSQDILLAAHVVSGTADQIVAFSTTTEAAAVFTYANGQLSASVVNLPSAYVQSGSTALAADIDGDGLDEIVVSNAFSIGAPLVLKWNGATFDVVVSPGSGSFLPLSSVLPLRVRGSSTLLFDYALGIQPPTVGVATVQGSEVNMGWTGKGAIPGYVGLNPTDVFCVADVDGDGNDELVMVSILDSWLFGLQWNGSELTPFSSAQGSAPGWSVNLLLDAPKTPMGGPPFGPAPFTGNQEAIYEQISETLYPAIANTVANDKCSSSDIRSCYEFLGAIDFTNLQTALNDYAASLGQPGPDAQAVIDGLSYDFIYGYISALLDPKCGADIRSEYLQLDYKYRSNFAILATQITGGLDVPPMTPLPGSTTTAWSAMSNQVAGELNGLASVILWSGSDVMGYLNTQLKAVQDTALSRATANVNETYTPPPESLTGRFWLTNCIDAVLWGIAAVPEIAAASPMAPVLLAMGASLFPEVMSAFQPSSQPPAQQIQYSDFAGLIDKQYSAASDLLGQTATTIMSDQVLLPLLGGLLNGTIANRLWTFTQDDVDNQATAAAIPATLQYYSIFIPMRFNILIWENGSRKGPYYCELRTDGDHTYYAPVSVGAPTYTYLTQPNTDGTYNVYLLCEGTDPSGPLNYPSTSLVTDVITTLNVPPLDFMNGVGIWSGISRSVVSVSC